MLSILAALGIDLFSIIEFFSGSGRVLLGDYTPGPGLYLLTICVTSVYVVAVLIGLSIRRRRGQKAERRQLRDQINRNLQHIVRDAQEKCYELAQILQFDEPNAETCIRFNQHMRLLSVELARRDIEFKFDSLNPATALERVDTTLAQLLAIEQELAGR